MKINKYYNGADGLIGWSVNVGNLTLAHHRGREPFLYNNATEVVLVRSSYREVKAAFNEVLLHLPE